MKNIFFVIACLEHIEKYKYSKDKCLYNLIKINLV